MASWGAVEREAPELVAAARRFFDAHVHKTLATLRRDGSPRISGVEVEFRDGELVLGSMPGARKAMDLRRDPRLAIHSPTVDPDEADPSSWPAEAKIGGRAVERSDLRRLDAPHEFVVDVGEVVLTRVDGDALSITLWHPGRGVEVHRRA